MGLDLNSRHQLPFFDTTYQPVEEANAYAELKTASRGAEYGRLEVSGASGSFTSQR